MTSSAPKQDGPKFFCDCITWARTDGRMTNHHPHCPKFVQIRFVRVHMHSGDTYTQPTADMLPLLDEIKEASLGEKWTLELIEMTREEYDRLPEFTGH